MILEDNPQMTFQEASKALLDSQTYAEYSNKPELYPDEGPDYFYDLWQNEQKYGKPIPSYLFELYGKKKVMEELSNN